MRRSFKAIAMAMLAATLGSPALAAGDAAAGLEAFSQYNLITLGDWTTNSHVDGKVLVGGNAKGGNGVVGAGGGGGSNTPVETPTIVIRGDNLLSGLTINNGSNGGSPLATGPSAVIGGNSTSGTLTLNGSKQTLVVGGNFSTTNMNVTTGDTISVGRNVNASIAANNAPSVRIGGTYNGNANSGHPLIQASQGIDFNASDVAAHTGIFTTLGADLAALSSSLASVSVPSNPSSYSIAGNLLTLTGVAGDNGFSVISLTAAELNSIGQIKYDFAGVGADPIVINVDGSAAVNLNANFLGGAMTFAQQVVWNFLGEEVTFSGSQFVGSVLAPNAHLTLASNNIDGNVAVGSFTQYGEVHNYGFNGSFPPPPAVPEPATWAMLLAGFGLVGSAMRGKKARAALA
ncbi:collagen-binding domain-containing protein [Sphingobium lignivorans]|uniref:Choice-of-anchor A domain-containing protein n=1 Tax=Sphingobium lignivorans TaxID=2735886 RepID=A0ABR6NFJ8_9SPHN|nr:collagen-binding domain-containing protein [Sphingobium lignivorans]MBB5986052.1 choice-of-anchor A domain-containing protein [Sphingobium lignivorans]